MKKTLFMLYFYIFTMSTQHFGRIFLQKKGH